MNFKFKRGRSQKGQLPKNWTKLIKTCFFFLSLSIFIAGYPQPMYRWLKNGVPVGDFDTSQYLKIQSTTREDAGSYQCLAKNDAGTIFSEKIDVVVACE